MRRCFELINDAHSKFWTVECVGCHYLATFGKIGTTGQTQVKSFATPRQAETKFYDMIVEKTRKGYREVISLQHPGAKQSLIDSLIGQPVKAATQSQRRAGQEASGRAIIIDD